MCRSEIAHAHSLLLPSRMTGVWGAGVGWSSASAVHGRGRGLGSTAAVAGMRHYSALYSHVPSTAAPQCTRWTLDPERLLKGAVNAYGPHNIARHNHPAHKHSASHGPRVPIAIAPPPGQPWQQPSSRRGGLPCCQLKGRLTHTPHDPFWGAPAPRHTAQPGRQGSLANSSIRARHKLGLCARGHHHGAPPLEVNCRRPGQQPLSLSLSSALRAQRRLHGLLFRRLAGPEAMPGCVLRQAPGLFGAKGNSMMTLEEVGLPQQGWTRTHALAAPPPFYLACAATPQGRQAMLPSPKAAARK